MRFPFEKWLKYLLQFSDFSPKEIIAVVDGFGFPAPTLEDLTFLKKQMAHSKPKPFRRNSQAALHWIREEGLWDMYSGCSHTRLAKRLLSQVHVRRTLEYLLVANTPPTDICEYIASIHGQTLPAEVVAAYKHYFCNTDLLVAKQWLEYFKEIPDETRVLTDCFQLRQPEFALWKLGYRIEVDRSDVFKTMFHEGYMRFIETSRMYNGIRTAQTGKIWSEVILDADTRMQGSTDRVQAILDELKDIRIKLGAREISSLEELRDDKG